MDMSIFDYEKFQRWEGFSDFNTATMKLRGATGDRDGLQLMFDGIPSDLKDQARMYLLEFSISSLSKKLLDFATAQGVLDLPDVTTSLELAIRIRDALFTNSRARESGHVELLAQLAPRHGEAFAADTMNAALDRDLAERKVGDRNGSSGMQRAVVFEENLLLAKRFLDGQAFTSTAVGNIAFRNFSVQSENHSPRGDFSKVLDLIIEYPADDLKAVMAVVKSHPHVATALASHIDAGLREDTQTLLRTQGYGTLFQALSARPLTAVSEFIAMREKDLANFASGPMSHTWVMGEWIDESNVRDLDDDLLFNQINLFNQRLTENAYFQAAFQRSESLHKPDSVGIPFILIAEKMKALQMVPNLSMGKYSSRNPVESLADGLLKLSESKRLNEVSATAISIIETEVGRGLCRAYEECYNDEVLGKRMQPPISKEDPSSGVDKDFQQSFMAVRLCAELHQDSQSTAAGQKKYTPYACNIGDIKGSIRAPKALTVLVKSYDEQTVLNALKDYKAGIMPLIKLGVLNTRHMDKVPLKDRGAFLESEMGI